MDEAIVEKESDVARMKRANKMAFDEDVEKLPKDTFHQVSYSSVSNRARELGDFAKLQINTMKRLMKKNILKPIEVTRNKRSNAKWKRKFTDKCSKVKTNLVCNKNAIYRTADGTCNNLKYTTWGSAMRPELRLMQPAYEDGVDEPRKTGRYGLPLESARRISNVVFRYDNIQPRNNKLTMMVMQWGQFLDHDLVLTPTLKGVMGANVQCCNTDGTVNNKRDECFAIEIPDNDTYFSSNCMNFVRSLPASKEQCDPGYRVQLNTLTSYIDASAVYGSSEAETRSLRDVNGLLKTGSYNLLPRNTPAPDSCVLKFPAKNWCQKAGDGRVDVVPSLGCSHTLFMREHNRIAMKLRNLNPHWSDETIFQETRKINAACLQHITYNEYLHAFLNYRTMRKYRLRSKRRGYARIYRTNINPTISNVFAAAAFRFGHSQVPDYQAIMDKSYSFTTKKPIESTYKDPHLLQANHGSGLDGIVRWLVADPTPLADR